MADEIKLWAIDGSSAQAMEVSATHRTETEYLLEEVLVANPEMLMPSLVLVGRQTPTTGGPLDLLGIDQDGRLVVFELKRGTLTRDAVAQAIDYASYLESLDEETLENLIYKHSGNNGIRKIESLSDEWTDVSQLGIETPPLKPIQIVLVGLGVDEGTERMVRYLAQGGTPIALLTFHGFTHGSQTLLARQVEVSPELSQKAKHRSGISTEKLNKLAEEWGVSEMLADMKASFKERKSFFVPQTKQGHSFLHQQFFNLPDSPDRHRRLFTVWLEGPGKIRVTLQPISIHLCEKDFHKLEKHISFEKQNPSWNDAPTSKVKHEYTCVLGADDWEQHKKAIIDFTGAVYDAATACVETRFNEPAGSTITDTPNER